MDLKLSATAATVAAFMTFGAASAEPAPPAGWRFPTAAEKADFARKGRKSIGPSVEQTYAISADFDGDGRPDRAVVLLNDATQRFAVFVLRAKIGRYQQLDYEGEAPLVWNYTLDFERPGAFETACGKGHGVDDSPPCRKKVRTRWPAIGVANYEASYVLFFWDGRKFDSEYLSD